MPLLFDPNISIRVTWEISAIFPGPKTSSGGWSRGKKDLEIWKWAKEQGSTIVSFDPDIADFSLHSIFSANVIGLRLGNSAIKSIAHQLIDRTEDIHVFLTAEHEEILMIESGF